MPRIPSVKELLSSLLRSSLPEETRLGPTGISLVGNRLVEISLCKGICCYERARISVYVNEGRLTVCGECLTLKTYRDRRIAIAGKIKSLLFEDA